MVLETSSAMTGLLNCQAPLCSFPQGPLWGQAVLDPEEAGELPSSPQESVFPAAACSGLETRGGQQGNSGSKADTVLHTPNQNLRWAGVGGSLTDQGQLGWGMGSEELHWLQS